MKSLMPGDLIPLSTFHPGSSVVVYFASEADGYTGTLVAINEYGVTLADPHRLMPSWVPKGGPPTGNTVLLPWHVIVSVWLVLPEPEPTGDAS